MRIGIILTGDYSWAGGVYYSLNIIQLLQKISLSKNLKIIVLINRHTQKELINEIALKNTELVNLDNKSFFYKLYCRLARMLTGINYRFIKDVNALDLDLIYPLINYEKGHEKLKCKVYYWLFDFQHKFLPELFTKEEIQSREINFKQVTEKAQHIVLSSHDSKKHLNHFYPDCKAQVDVYNFVSLIEKPVPGASIKVPPNYLIVCNQFWPHKNHLIVLKAIELLVKQNKSIHVVFTGKYDDVRNENYVKELKTFIDEKQLEANITLTGFISRKDQVILMHGAKAIVQPSLFEGWSTVVEDAKALNKFLIVSDIAIHREQITADVLFFKPADALKLSEYLELFFKKEMETSGADYSKNITRSESDLEKTLGII